MLFKTATSNQDDNDQESEESESSSESDNDEPVEEHKKVWLFFVHDCIMLYHFLFPKGLFTNDIFEIIESTYCFQFEFIIDLFWMHYIIYRYLTDIFCVFILYV